MDEKTTSQYNIINLSIKYVVQIRRYLSINIQYLKNN